MVDDDRAINELIKVNLKLSGYTVIQAFDGVEGFALAKQELPNLAILDVMMPNVDGYTVAQRIRQYEPIKNIPIIMLTALSDIQDKGRGFDIGVDDYMVKPFEIEELKMRIKALLKRTHQLPESLATKELMVLGEITLLPEQYSVKINDKVAKLTPIEFDIFNILFQNHGNMVSSAKLLKDVWGYEPDDDVETIRVHIRHLRTKIDKISDGKKYIETIYGGGYKLSVWLKGGYSDTGLTTPTGYNTKVTLIAYYNKALNTSGSNSAATATYTVLPHSDWGEYTVDLDSSKTVYAFGIHLTKADGTIYLPVDDVKLYTSFPYNTNWPVGVYKTNLKVGGNDIPVTFAFSDQQKKVAIRLLNNYDAGVTSYTYNESTSIFTINTNGEYMSMTYGTITGKWDKANNKLTNVNP